MTSERANKGVLITSGYFTSSAIKFATDKPIELIDGSKLNVMLNNYGLNDENGLSNSKCKGYYFGSFTLKYTKYKSNLKEDPLDYKSLQDLIHLFMQAIISDTMSGIYNPNKQEYDDSIDECLSYLTRITLCQYPQCIYTVNYCKCIFSKEILINHIYTASRYWQ